MVKECPAPLPGTCPEHFYRAKYRLPSISRNVTIQPSTIKRSNRNETDTSECHVVIVLDGGDHLLTLVDVVPWGRVIMPHTEKMEDLIYTVERLVTVTDSHIRELMLMRGLYGDIIQAQKQQAEQIAKLMGRIL